MTTLDLVCVRVSFQRYPRPEGGVVVAPPRSWGAQPIGFDSSGRCLVPLAEDEALWIGLSVPHPSVPALVQVEIETDDGDMSDAVTGAEGLVRPGLVVPPTMALDGIARAAGRHAFVRSGEAPRTRVIVMHVHRARHGQLATPASRPLEMHAASAGEGPRQSDSGQIDMPAAERWLPCEPHVMRVWLVAPDVFASQTRLPVPGPMLANETYGGWRLP